MHFYLNESAIEMSPRSMNLTYTNCKKLLNLLNVCPENTRQGIWYCSVYPQDNSQSIVVTLRLQFSMKLLIITLWYCSIIQVVYENK